MLSHLWADCLEILHGYFFRPYTTSKFSTALHNENLIFRGQLKHTNIYFTSWSRSIQYNFVVPLSFNHPVNFSQQPSCCALVFIFVLNLIQKLIYWRSREVRNFQKRWRLFRGEISSCHRLTAKFLSKLRKYWHGNVALLRLGTSRRWFKQPNGYSFGPFCKEIGR